METRQKEIKRPRLDFYMGGNKKLFFVVDIKNQIWRFSSGKKFWKLKIKSMAGRNFFFRRISYLKNGLDNLDEYRLE